jgi:hypothetical protein
MTAMQELVVPKSIPITLAIKIQYIPAIQVPFNEYIYNMLIYSTLCYFFGLFVPKKIETFWRTMSHLSGKMAHTP